MIRALIQYFSWRDNRFGKSLFVTRAFDSVWEKMLAQYLNRNFFDYDSSSHNIVFRPNCNKYTFNKVTEVIDQGSTGHEPHSVEYDYLGSMSNKGKIMIFDAKYFSSKPELNYKQISYHYFMCNQLDGTKRAASDIINGLILPREEGYSSATHLDRRGIDDIYIQEHYLGIREVMREYVNI